MPKWMKEKLAFEQEDDKLQQAAAAAAAKAAAKAADADDLDLAPVARAKAPLNIVFLGPPKCGKSTTIGHLSHRFGALTKKELKSIEKTAVLQGRGPKKMAWSIDRTQLERDQDTSIQSTCTTFVSKRYCICAINVPSQRKYLKNALSGITQADAVLLVLPMVESEFEQGLGIHSKTSILHDHLYAAFAFGVRQVLVAMNKMDSIQHAQHTYEEKKERVLTYLTDVIGFKKEGIEFIPTVATDGDNMFPSELIEKRKRKSSKYHPGLAVANENMKWYKGTTLIEMIDNIVQPPAVALSHLPIVTYSAKVSPTNSASNSPMASPMGSPMGSPRLDSSGVVAVGFKTKDVQKEDGEDEREEGDAEEEDEEEEDDDEEDDDEEDEGHGTEDEKDKEDSSSNAGAKHKDENRIETKAQDETASPAATSQQQPQSPKISPQSVRSSKSSKFWKSSKTVTRRGTALRMPVSKVYQIPGVGTIAVGRIVSGSIQQYEKLRIVPGPLDFLNLVPDDDHDDTLVIPEDETELELEARLSLGEVAKVKSIQTWKNYIIKRGQVRVGDYCGIHLTTVNKNVGAPKKNSAKGQKGVKKRAPPFVRQGTVLASFGVDQYPLRTVKEFEATIVLYNLPRKNSETSLGVSAGYTPIVHVHTAHVQCRIVEIVRNRARGKDDRVAPEVDPFVDMDRKKDGRTSRRVTRGRKKAEARESSKRRQEEKKAKEAQQNRKIMIKTGDCVDVRFVPLRPLCVEPFDVCPALARFVLRDGGRVVGSGIVKSVKFGMHQGSHALDDDSSSEEDEDEEDSEDSEGGGGSEEEDGQDGQDGQDVQEDEVDGVLEENEG